MERPIHRLVSRRRLVPAVAVATVVLAAIVWPIAAHFYTDLRWFRSVGYGDVFTTVLGARVGVGVVVALLVAAALWLNLYLAARLTRGLAGVRLQDPTGTARLDVGSVAPRLALPLCLLVGIGAGFPASDHWATWLRWRHAVDVGARDPLLGHDVGFYLFRLPALEAVGSLVAWVLVLSFLGAAAMHAVRGGLRATGRGLTAQPRTRLHLSVLGALFFVWLAFEAWLDAPRLMYSTTGPVAGASYADVHARLPALRVEIAAALVAAALVAASATRRRLGLLVAGVGLYLVVEVLGVRVYPAIVQRFEVLPNEAAKEAPFISHNIAATRAAYRLDEVDERELSGETSIDRADIERNRATVENIRLWDHQQLLDTFSQIQEIRTYYEFASVDNDRYVIDGELRQTMLSPRELAAESLPSRTWINEHFTFTHGYGLTLGPVDAATDEGLPVLFVKDIPPVSSVDEIQVTRPAIYFGELSNDYVFVRTAAREFDHPSGEDNVYSSYDGAAGVHLDSAFTRAAMATRVGALKLLLSDDIDEDSRILLYRNVRDRVQRIAPFLRFDSDPYMIVREDGTLAWIQDAYTVSDRYPYAQPIGGLNYIRNSVKAVVDAYDGTVTFYAADPDDPLLKVWKNIFPALFTSMDEMPEDVRAHLRYPEDIFRIQTELFTIYHMAEPDLVYNREDQWEIPSVQRSGTVERMVPYYTVMRLPGEEDAEYIQMIPFTPKRKDNLAAWMVVRMDGEHLGEMIVYTFPRDRLVFGPQQVMNRISQDADISRQISLWDQRGSQVIMGTLLVIPIEQALLYVTPLYLRSEGGRIPELKRVIVSYENRIAMQPTLDAAIDELFGPAEGEAPAAAGRAEAEPPTEAEPEADTRAEPEAGDAPERPAAVAADATPGDLARQARRHFERAVEAQRRGDWAGYGEELGRLEALLRRMAPEPE